MMHNDFKTFRFQKRFYNDVLFHFFINRFRAENYNAKIKQVVYIYSFPEKKHKATGLTCYMYIPTFDYILDSFYDALFDWIFTI